MIDIRPDWLAEVTEPAVEPDLPICDAHHHLWNHVEPTYLLDDFRADLASGHRIVSTVFVECTTSYDDIAGQIRFVGETRYIDSLADQAVADGDATGVAAGIISRADLTKLDTLGEVLDAHAAASHRFRGIRHSTSWDADPAIEPGHTRPWPGMMAEPEFAAGARALAERGLVFDAWCYFPQLGEFAQLARTVPDLQIVLDHVGGVLGIGSYADDPAASFDAWAVAIDGVAQLPNVVVKLGGLSMTRTGFGWDRRDRPPTSDELAEATAPYVRHVIDRFGAERCMFESNFPMDKLSCSYGVLWNSFKKITADLPAADRAQLFRGTAERIYGIAPD